MMCSTFYQIMRSYLYTCSVVLIVVHVFVGSCNGDEIIRDTNYGKVQGFSSISSQIFLGIPYAAPANRWEAPKEPIPWNYTLEATKMKPMCYQTENCAAVNPVGTCLPQMSEECLYLNIFAPLNTTTVSRKAVMLFIHGGGFEFSSGGADIYNGETISSKGDVIIVTFNYRLGAFGFLVTGEGSGEITGNYGILDQIQALRWVHENIDAFGGDNKMITLFGQSAGALSIAIHMTSQEIADLFHRVIIESSPFTIPLKPASIAIQQGTEFAALLECSVQNVTCLMSKSAEEIATAQGRYFQQAMFSDSYLRKFLPWTPHIDEINVKYDLMKAFSNGAFVPKPAILGTTSEEGQLYIYLGFGKMSALEYRMLLLGIRPQQSGDIYEMYRPLNNSDARESLSELTTDFVFYCPARAVARALSYFAPVYTYVFNNNISMPDVWNHLTHCVDRVCHGIELPYVFQSANKEPWVFTDDEFRLSDSMIQYWTNFAKTGNPNSYTEHLRIGHTAGPQSFWPPYQPHGYFPELSIILDDHGNYLTQGYRYDKCNLWDQGEYRAKK